MDSAKVDEIQQMIVREPAYRQVLRKTLEQCKEQATAADLERSVAAMPEMSFAVQEPYEMIDRLARYGAISQDGESFVITEEGRQALDALAPAKQFSELVAQKPELEDLYLQTLSLCAEGKDLQEITAVLEEDDRVATINRFDNRVYPAYFLHNLRLVGLAQWDEVWKTTPEGDALLAAS